MVETNKCINCGKEIVKINNRWYHVESNKRYCSTKVAKPSEEELKSLANGDET